MNGREFLELLKERSQEFTLLGEFIGDSEKFVHEDSEYRVIWEEFLAAELTPERVRELARCLLPEAEDYAAHQTYYLELYRWMGGEAKNAGVNIEPEEVARLLKTVI